MLALTMGDPAGIGGELTVKAWRALREEGPAFVALDEPGRLEAMGAPVRVVGTVREAEDAFREALPVMAVGLEAPVVPGRPDARNAGAVISSIERAVGMARGGEVSGVVTNPIAKSVLYEAGFKYPGHTEFLGALTGCTLPVMMLANRFMRVVPVTVHVGLRAALDLLSTELIVQTSLVVARALRESFGVGTPRLGMAGLNPHAGEGGALGDEEGKLIQPAIERLRAEGIAVVGPYPPDAMFTEGARTGYDAAICMYHDQALIPLKTLDVASGVNVTLGLPIVRTSPDHGTAFDIAGRGVADPSSLIAALRLAAEMGLASRFASGGARG